jgi:hypothetical protein
MVGHSFLLHCSFSFDLSFAASPSHGRAFLFASLQLFFCFVFCRFAVAPRLGENSTAEASGLRLELIPLTFAD